MLKVKAGYAKEAIVDFLYVLLNNHNLERALEVIGSEADLLKEIPDFHFVCGLIYTELAIAMPEDSSMLIPMIETSYLQCLNLGGQSTKEIVNGTSTYLAAYNLGIFYEFIDMKERAKECYQFSASHNYTLAMERLSNL